MSRPSLLWYALRDIGRGPMNDPTEVGALLAETVRGIPDLDPNETHVQVASSGRSYPMSLLANALQDWPRSLEVTAFADEVPVPLAIEQPARALLDRGAALWNLPEDQRAQILGAIFDHGMWALWETVLSLPDRPDWRTIMDMKAQVAAAWLPPTVWSRIATQPRILTTMVRTGLPPDYTHSDGQTLLFANRGIEVARWVVAQGASPSTLDEQGKNAAAHHRPHLNAEQQGAWFDLCGREMAPEAQIRLALTSSKAGFLQAVKKPGEVRWSPQPGIEINALDAALQAAVPNVNQKPSQPALFQHLLDSSIIWPTPTRAMAGLAWIASYRPENKVRQDRIEGRLGEALTLPALTAALPQWLAYITPLDPEHRLRPYQAWWNHSKDPTWRQAVMEVQLAHLQMHPELWRKETPPLGHGGRLAALIRAAAQGQAPEEWNVLTRSHRFALAAWSLSSHRAIKSEKAYDGLSGSLKEEDQNQVRAAMHVLDLLTQEGESLLDPRWAHWRTAMEGLRGDPLHQMLSAQRERALQQRPAPVAPPRPRRRS